MATLKDVRVARGLSQHALAANAGVSPRIISKIENGHPVLESIKRSLCQALGTNDLDIQVVNRVRQSASKQ